MYYQTFWHSPVGELTLAGDDDVLTGLWIAGQKYFGQTLPDDAEERDDAPVFRQAKDWLESYFAGKKPSPSHLPLAPAGGTFRRQVWEILCSIPYGTVTTYGEIGKMLADQTGRERISAQAIGGAVGHNPISIIIPCHRVVGANGSLTGYAGGIQTKARLLELEGVQMSRLFVPKTGTAV
jgi:methylated-DNA-[protein]-cysteine S-methyltransferase